MWFPFDSWGKIGLTLSKGKLVAIGRKKNRKLSRQIRNMDKREREIQCNIRKQVIK